ncbi:MAG: peptidoglycan DD-metalloendopeptidase family protein [Bacteroidales bacterium]|jgi:murein DD-endopeptidase MepM/ murein hydrolase activator NlpD|nr:peptidoglycan DD-metalloendopeptidase family protein [Bacteroidales bacterium]
MKTKKITLVILALFSVSGLFAQTETAAYKKVVERFTYYYNNNMSDSIFHILSKEMQEFLPIEKAKDFIASFTQQFGNITKTGFIRYNSSLAVYKAQFELGVLALNISLDKDSKINGISFKPYIPNNLPVMERNQTKLILPFENEWTVVWGGDTKEDNYHVDVQSQKNAFDFVIRNETGKSFRTNGNSNEDYYCFGRKLIAPCDGEVVLVVDGVKDNIPGEMNSFFPTGNTVVLKTMNNEYFYLCHFKHHSIAVKEGQNVKQGDLLGFCGNSGNSSEPHLHFHIQNVENMNIATGVKCYFEQILVNKETKTNYSPKKGERESN